MRARLALLSVSMMLLVGCDHASKAWAEAALPGASIQLVPQLVDLRYVRNHDVAFNLLRWLPDHAQMPAALLAASVAIAALVFLWLRRRDAGRLEHAAFALMFAGAVGNFVDRGVRGYVVDFIHVHYRPLFDWPIFNVADVLVVAGAGLLALTLARDRRRRTAPG